MKLFWKNVIVTILVFGIFFVFVTFSMVTLTKKLPTNQSAKPSSKFKKSSVQPTVNSSLSVATQTPTNSFSILRLQDVGPIDDYRQKRIEPDKSIKGKAISNSNVGVRVAPTDEFVENYKKNDNDLKKTLDEVDINRPPVKGEIKISF